MMAESHETGRSHSEVENREETLIESPPALPVKSLKEKGNQSIYTIRVSRFDSENKYFNNLLFLLLGFIANSMKWINDT